MAARSVVLCRAAVVLFDGGVPEVSVVDRLSCPCSWLLGVAAAARRWHVLFAVVVFVVQQDFIMIMMFHKKNSKKEKKTKKRYTPTAR
jgi:hypothetical protein